MCGGGGRETGKCSGKHTAANLSHVVHGAASEWCACSDKAWRHKPLSD